MSNDCRADEAGASRHQYQLVIHASPAAALSLSDIASALRADDLDIDLPPGRTASGNICGHVGHRPADAGAATAQIVARIAYHGDPFARDARLVKTRRKRRLEVLERRWMLRQIECCGMREIKIAADQYEGPTGCQAP